MPFGEPHSCQICRADRLDEIEEYASLPRFTSDTKPWPPGGRLAVCAACGTAQKIPDAKWHDEAARIYRDYEIYHHSGGLEQAVFDGGSGTAERRSDRIAGHLKTVLDPAGQGSVLDIGCGSGVTLDAFSRALPQWCLYGHNLDGRHRSELGSKSNFRALYTGGIAEIPGRYDIVTLVHAFEHFAEPMQLLHDVRERISERGWLCIHAPDTAANPFDFLVADHLVHLTGDTLRFALETAGYEVRSLSDSVILKELTIVGRPRIRGATAAAPPAEAPAARGIVSRQVAWLHAVLDAARSLAAAGTFGIFGTSNVATWLAAAVGGRIAFFVDEDPDRVGKTFLGRPVLSPQQAPAGAQVCLALAPTVALKVHARLRGLPAAFRLLPAID